MIFINILNTTLSKKTKKVPIKKEPVKAEIKTSEKPAKKEISASTVEIPTMKNKKAEIIEFIISQKKSEESEAVLNKLKKADLLKLIA